MVSPMLMTAVVQPSVYPNELCRCGFGIIMVEKLVKLTMLREVAPFAIRHRPQMTGVSIPNLMERARPLAMVPAASSIALDLS